MLSSMVVLAFSAIASAQTINPDSVAQSQRDAWCRDQRSSCPLLCLQTSTSASTVSNTCDSKTLAWTCVCTNGLTPNVSEYSLTIPYYICTESNNQCVKACGQNNQCASDCRTKNPCGAQNPTRVNSTSTTSSTATGSSSSSTGTFDSFGGSGSSSSGKSAASSTFQIGQTYGLGVVAAGLFATFAYLL